MRRKLDVRPPRHTAACLGAATVAAFLAFGASAQADPFVYVTNGGGDSVSQYGIGPGGLLASLFPSTVTAAPIRWGWR